MGVSPAHVRGTYGSLCQIAACLGILGALFIGIPAKNISGWWRACFWISAIPAAFLALGMELCAESPQWLAKGLFPFLLSNVPQPPKMYFTGSAWTKLLHLVVVTV